MMDYARCACLQERTPSKETRRKAEERRRPPNECQRRNRRTPVQEILLRDRTGRSRRARTPPHPRRDVAQSGTSVPKGSI
ncbi:hypothetical protein NDU88_002124 [Pleurodeles waltl]|uniref:Uncharacterized protein n=1 Tax=Pleurodeles waltl TaxID=8319 RepID=A0AAV7M325_PLEWA|nr:hypothetical protein NDU88_002124 [Pleurodeles waltl]